MGEKQNRKFRFFQLKLKNFFVKPEQIFLLLAGVAGVIMVFLLPLFRAPDELAHFHRAYQVGEGQVFSQTLDGKTGGRVPNTTKEHYYEKVNLSSLSFTEFPSSALYSPVSYIPQAIGIDLGKLTYPSIANMIIIGRLFNLAAYVLLVWLAIKIARQGKWVYAVAGLFPMAIHQAASLSSDAVNIGLVFIVIAAMQSLFFQKELLSRKQYIFGLLLAFCIGLTKQTNIIILLPILFLPSRLFSSQIRRVGYVAGLFFAALLPLILWYAASKFHQYDFDFATAAGVDQVSQLKHVLSHPFSFIETLLKTFILEGKAGVATGDFFVISMVGFFSWISYKLPIVLVVMSYVILFIAFFYRDQTEQQHVSNRSVWTHSLTLFASIVAIAGALYLTWTPVGASQVAGIQGRYFIGLIPLAIPFFAWASRWLKLSFDAPNRMGILVFFVSFINLAAMTFLTYMWFY